MLNLIAFIVCLLCAVFWGFRGDVGMVLFEIMLAAVNLPWVIMWVKER